MRLELDDGLCQAHGMCVVEAPGVFALGRNDRHVTILVGHITPDQIAAVRNAVKYCPTMALRLVED